MSNYLKARPCVAVSHKRRKRTLATANVYKRNEFSSQSRETQYEHEEHFTEVTDCETNTTFQNETNTSMNRCEQSAKYVETSAEYQSSTNVYYKKRFSDDGSVFENNAADCSATQSEGGKIEEQTFQERNVKISQQVEFKGECAKSTLVCDRDKSSAESTNRATGTNTSGFVDFDRDSSGDIFGDDLILQDDTETECQLGNGNSPERNNISRGNMLLMSNHEEESQCLRRDSQMETGRESGEVQAANIHPQENIDHGMIKIVHQPQTIEKSSNHNTEPSTEKVDKASQSNKNTVLNNNDISSPQKCIEEKHTLQPTSPSNLNEEQSTLIHRNPGTSCNCLTSCQSNDLKLMSSHSKISIIYDNHQVSSTKLDDSVEVLIEPAKPSWRYVTDDAISLGSSLSSTSTYIITERSNCVTDKLKIEQHLLGKSLEVPEKNSSPLRRKGSPTMKSLRPKLLEDGLNRSKAQTRESNHALFANVQATDDLKENSGKFPRNSRAMMLAESEHPVATDPNNVQQGNYVTYFEEMTKTISPLDSNHNSKSDVKIQIGNASSISNPSLDAAKESKKIEISVERVCGTPVRGATMLGQDSKIRQSQPLGVRTLAGTQHTKSREDARIHLNNPPNETPKAASKSSMRRRYTMNKRIGNKFRMNELSKQIKNPPRTLRSISSLSMGSDSADEAIKAVERNMNSKNIPLGWITARPRKTAHSQRAKSIANHNVPGDMQCINQPQGRRPPPHQQRQCMQQFVTRPTVSQINDVDNKPTEESTSKESPNEIKRKTGATSEPNTAQKGSKIIPASNDIGKSRKKQSAREARPSLVAQLDVNRENSTTETPGTQDWYLSSQTPRSLALRSSVKSSPLPSPEMTPCYSYPQSLNRQVKTLRQRQEDATRAFLSRQKASLAKKSGNLGTKDTAFKITFPSDVRCSDGRQIKQASDFNRTKLIDKISIARGRNVCSKISNDEDDFWEKDEGDSFNSAGIFGNAIDKNCMSLPSTPRNKASGPLRPLIRPRSFSPPLWRSAPLCSMKEKIESTNDICSEPTGQKSNVHTFDISQESQNNNRDMDTEGVSKCGSNIRAGKSSPRVFDQTRATIHQEDTNEKKLPLFYDSDSRFSDADFYDNAKSIDNSKKLQDTDIAMAGRKIPYRHQVERECSQESENKNIQLLESANQILVEKEANRSVESPLNYEGGSFNVARKSKDLIYENIPNDQKIRHAEQKGTETIDVHFSPAKLPTGIDNQPNANHDEGNNKPFSAPTNVSSSSCTSDEKASETSTDLQNTFSDAGKSLENLLKEIVKKSVTAYLQATQPRGVDPPPQTAGNNKENACSLSDQKKRSRDGAQGLKSFDRSSGSKSRETAAHMPYKLKEDEKQSRNEKKNTELIQLFPTMKPARVPQQKDEILTTIKTKQNTTREEKHVQGTHKSNLGGRKAKHVAYLLSESKIESRRGSPQEMDVSQDISNDNLMNMVKKHYYAVPQRESLVCCDRCTQKQAMGKKPQVSPDNDCDLIPTKEKSTTLGNMKAPLCLFGWVKNSPDLRHIQTPIDIHRTNLETNTVKNRKNVKLSSDRSRRKILAESKTSEDGTEEKLKTNRRETKKTSRTRRSSELDAGAMPVLQEAEEISDARLLVGGGLKETLWAVTQINVFNDGSRTYEVMKPEKKRPASVPEQTHNVFAIMAPKKKMEHIFNFDTNL